jgi:hypothetical protein
MRQHWKADSALSRYIKIGKPLRPCGNILLVEAHDGSVRGHFLKIASPLRLDVLWPDPAGERRINLR